MREYKDITDIKTVNLEDIDILPPDTGKIKQDVLEKNVEIRLLKLERDISSDEKKLREKMLYPDLEIGISYMQRDSSPMGMKRADMITLMAGINIPIWYRSKNLNDIEEMRKKEIMIDSLVEDKKNELISRTESISAEILKLYQLNRLYVENLLPQTELAIETDLSAFKTQDKEMMAVIDTIRQYLRFKKEIFSMKKEYLILNSEIKMMLTEEVIE